MELLGANLSALPRPQEYDFERHFDELQAIQWMRENWRKSFSFALAYVLLIFGGQHVMKQRRGYDLRKPLVLWSLSLALFSIIGTLRTWGYMGFVLSTSGFKQSVCDPGFYNGPVSKFWAYMFVLSKVPELGDTVFIVLRKQRLIFLHWYHHVTVLLYTWYAYKDMVAGGGWFMTMNYSVHAFMYSYYTVRAAGLRVPRPFAMVITFTQILQMVMGTAVSIMAYSWMQDGICSTSWEQIFWSSIMYLSYLVLFCHFFHEAYLKGRGKTKGD
ncbi:elongation of very long chain fatty acids protein 3 [Trachemys scripta elegans]|uniref:Elongation of very long chain fatty acids protein n=1 Tax=Chrysemys picta bellii TaxID=8478 RepID=A0A8C3I5Z2_CHRPI|nr:elongation of very long chain fatty acids protein 3 [Chrysemys picta bellii]XP_034632736.1 elongation of very long chain fatty acids protein 3 [Trachemys scripta elegans]XP_053891143.1 elongation of very long chain fatty acids protein 3 [Malaclemys terrapin pileata]